MCFLYLLLMSENTCCRSSTKVQSYEGGSVSISCPYESLDQNNMKYICRGNQPSSCLQQALITSNNRQNTQFSLTDDKVSRKFTVTITSLTQKDSGSYLCGVQRNTGLDVFSAVDLEVRGESIIIIISENTCCDSSTKVQSYEGGSVSICCPYESQDQNNMKYICRGNQPSSCLQQALITSNNRQNTQFSLTDDKESRKFTVTITSLTQKDSGSYLCGVKRNTGLNDFSAVDLEVRGERSQIYLITH
uniref:Ig-like domain-containing protein n=1 Tax=Anabas testudineus TaxID=64144 RepID=A0A3Q1J084_ANATE